MRCLRYYSFSLNGQNLFVPKDREKFVMLVLLSPYGCKLSKSHQAVYSHNSPHERYSFFAEGGPQESWALTPTEPNTMSTWFTRSASHIYSDWDQIRNNRGEACEASDEKEEYNIGTVVCSSPREQCWCSSFSQAVKVTHTHTHSMHRGVSLQLFDSQHFRTLRFQAVRVDTLTGIFVRSGIFISQMKRLLIIWSFSSTHVIQERKFKSTNGQEKDILIVIAGRGKLELITLMDASVLMNMYCSGTSLPSGA